MYQMLVIVIVTAGLVLGATSQRIYMQFGSHQQTLYDYGTRSNFVYDDDVFDCRTQLFPYQQSEEQYASNAAFQITVTDNTQQLSVSVSTIHFHFQPSLSSSICQANGCTLSLNHNCGSLNSKNYFDTVQLTFGDLGVMSYSLDCNSNYIPVHFEVSDLLLIFIAVLLLMTAACLGRFNAFQGKGLEFDWKNSLIVAAGIIVVDVLSVFTPTTANIVMDIISFIGSMAGVSVILVEALYLTKIDLLSRTFQIKGIEIRVMEVTALVLSLGPALGWILSDKNWIISDIISACILIAIVKFFKFTSYKMALLAYFCLLVIHIGQTLLVALYYMDAFSNHQIDVLDSPFQLQIPFVEPTFHRKCTWIPLTAIIVPALLLHYLKRFDTSRVTHVYFFICTLAYLVGSIFWWIASTFSKYPLPFNVFCEPIMMLSFTAFAFKRKELRTLWEGTFFDQEYANKKEVQQLQNRVTAEEPSNLTDHLSQPGMFFNPQEDSQFQKSQSQSEQRPARAIGNSDL